MPNPLVHIPTETLEAHVRMLEGTLLEGMADAPDIDSYVAMAAELGRRMVLTQSTGSVLDGIVDPRD